MSQGIVIGLTGLAGVGKDTVADYLVEHYGFTKVAFADEMKRVLREMNPILGMDLYNTGEMILLNEALDRYGEHGVKEVYPAYRKYLQSFGTEGIRSIEANFWVNAAMRKITAKSNYVFTDVRFPNEAAAIGDARGTLWQIERPQVGQLAHVSESWVGKMGEEYLIANTGSLDKLAHEIEYALRSIERYRMVMTA